jgi:hypothetical protein
MVDVTPRIYFTNTVYHSENRTFTGTIDLTNGGVTDWRGRVSEEWTVIFSDDFFETEVSWLQYDRDGVSPLSGWTGPVYDYNICYTGE